MPGNFLTLNDVPVWLKLRSERYVAALPRYVAALPEGRPITNTPSADYGVEVIADSFAQSITVNYMVQVERVTELGTLQFLPATGFEAVTLQMRRVAFNTANQDIAQLSIGDEIYEVKVGSNASLIARNCLVSTVSRGVTAGQVLIYDDITLECVTLEANNV